MGNSPQVGIDKPPVEEKVWGFYLCILSILFQVQCSSGSKACGNITSGGGDYALEFFLLFSERWEFSHKPQREKRSGEWCYVENNIIPRKRVL